MEAETSRESLERKARSEARLRKEGVPMIEHPPAIEDERTANLRSVDEIVDRAIALMAVAGVGEGAPEALVSRFMREFRADEKLTPMERAFIERPTNRARVQFLWRYQALHVLLWSLGFIPELQRPEKPFDPSLLGREILLRGEATLRADARLRPAAEILDEADLIYRYHWATRNAGLTGKPSPAGLNQGVVMERHHALNWLLGYGECDWDEVTTDT